MTAKKNPAEVIYEELTRREWLLRLSEIVALAGVSGVLPDAAMALIGTKERIRAPLPSGLYEPSSKHLIHALASAQELRNPPPGSETEYVQSHSGPYQPKFLSEEEFQIVSQMMEIVLGEVDPATLTQTARWFDLWLHSAPGVREAACQLEPLHRALAVAFYGGASVRELETADPQAAVHAGFVALQERSRERFNRGFLQASKAEQVELVRAASGAPHESPLGRFYGLIRGEAIRGYYTSAKGLKELDYKGNAYYPECPGCERS